MCSTTLEKYDLAFWTSISPEEQSVDFNVIVVKRARKPIQGKDQPTC